MSNFSPFSSWRRDNSASAAPKKKARTNPAITALNKAANSPSAPSHGAGGFPAKSAAPSHGAGGFPPKAAAAPSHGAGSYPSATVSPASAPPQSAKNPGVGTQNMTGKTTQRGGVRTLQTRYQRDSGLAMDSRKKK